MIQKSCLFVLISFLFLASLAIGGEAAYNPNAAYATRYFFCTVNDSVDHRTVYYSSIFSFKGEKLWPIQNAYVHFLAEKYGYKIQPGLDEYHTPGRCYGVQSVTAANQTKSLYTDQDNRSANKVIQTGWTFDSQKALDATASSESTSASSSSSTNTLVAQSDQLDAYTQATLEQDPRAARLSPLDRQFVISESRKSKGYCAKDPQLSQVFDCTCFVRTVFNYRIAHASSPVQTTNFPPLPSILEKQDFKDTLSACKKPD